MKKLFALIVAVATTMSFPAISEEYNIIDQEEHPEIYCLALNIYFEARGESTKGQYAVADVTLNRVESDSYPDSICDVVYQDSQFSWTHQIRNPRNPRISEREAWHDAQLFAMEVAVWGVMRGITDGATYFHASGTRPYWSRIFTKTRTIGGHLFYRSSQN